MSESNVLVVDSETVVIETGGAATSEIQTTQDTPSAVIETSVGPRGQPGASDAMMWATTQW